MRVIVAPDSFKGSVSALGVAEAMARGIRAVYPEASIHLVPIADGGEGTVEALVAATGGTLRHTEVRGPLGDPVRAHWGVSGDGATAYIEMASASGLALLAEPIIRTLFETGKFTAADTAAAKVTAQEAELRIAQNNAGYATLTADQPGVVTALLAEVGQVVAQGQAVFRVARLGEVEAVPGSGAVQKQQRMAGSGRINGAVDFTDGNGIALKTHISGGLRRG